MAIYNLRMSSAKGRNVVFKFNYITRNENFTWEKDVKYDDFIFAESVNMPDFANNDPHIFWKSVSENEFISYNEFREIEFTLPHELTIEENIELAQKFAGEVLGNKHPYTLAIHSKPSSEENINNIHCHIIFSERELDGIERNEEQFFKRYNTKNTEKGGAKKVDWSRLNKLYYVRQTWERVANEKLEEIGEKISSKSLKSQRIEALLEENYLKAEMLDREPINIEFQDLKYNYCTNKDYKKKLEFFEQCKKIKAIKIKEYNLRCKNFDEENQKAKERFINSVKEELALPINAVHEEKKVDDLFKIEVEEYFNYENIFRHSLDNAILKEKKERRLKQIQSITKKDLEVRAYNILTKNEYKTNLEKLNKLEEIYTLTPNKEKFAFKEEREQLLSYFSMLERNEVFQYKLEKTIENISAKYEKEKELILDDLNVLRKDEFSEFHNTDNLKLYELSRQLLNEIPIEIEKYKEELEKCNQEVKEYKLNYLDENILLKELCNNIGREDVAKEIDRLAKLKEDVKVVNSVEEELLKKQIRAIEGGLKKFFYNNFNDKFTEIMSERREHYKQLREKQDDLKGRVAYCFDTMKKLKEIKENNILTEISDIKKATKYIQESDNNLAKLLHNTKIDLFNSKFREKYVISEDVLSKIELNLDREQKIELSKKIVDEINILKEDNTKLQNNIDKYSFYTDKEKLDTYILDKLTNNLYSTTSNQELKFKLKMEYTITDEMRKDTIAKLRSQHLDSSTKLASNNEQLKVLFNALKQIAPERVNSKFNEGSIVNIKNKKLKVMQSGEIEFEEDIVAKERRKILWENSR